jgi:arabinogalactan endo-1,4-beta-galactosidase
MRKMKLISLLALTVAAIAQPAAGEPLYFGADLSFAGQMADCGARYRDTDGKIHDIYTIFKNHGANLIRFRLWTDGNRTGYSDLLDVERGIRNAKALSMQVQLDFHYSDSWADAEHQIIPQAWAQIAHPVTDGRPQAQPTRARQLQYDRALADTLYQYTYYILTTLDRQGLMPDEVQVGNEINPEVLGYSDWQIVPYSKYNRPIDWERDAMIINAGIKAVRDAGAKSTTRPRVMLQIAHAKQVEPWFAAATKAGITDFDMIGISYYAYHNATASLHDLGEVIRRLRKTYPGKLVEVIETGYPWTSDPDRLAHSNPNANDLLPQYPATPEGQKNYLFDLARTILDAGGAGLNYWAPDQVPNKCNVHGNTAYSLFDPGGNVLPGIDFMRVRADARAR